MCVCVRERERERERERDRDREREREREREANQVHLTIKRKRWHGFSSGCPRYFKFRSLPSLDGERLKGIGIRIGAKHSFEKGCFFNTELVRSSSGLPTVLRALRYKSKSNPVKLDFQFIHLGLAMAEATARFAAAVRLEVLYANDGRTANIADHGVI